MLALAAVLFLLSQFYRVANAVIASDLQRDLGLDFFVMLGAATYLHAMGWMLDRSALPGGAVAVAFLLYMMTRDPRPARPAPAPAMDEGRRDARATPVRRP